eukprot:GHVL01023770.1.p1 GENE.GHVL01023770.1~~GHVL01023770.1.p1  ORF type:complete len:607 (+),score=53.58 GHVL01023770.1:52-1872(+)
MSVAVLGGCGFVGHHLVKELVKRGYTVRVVDIVENSKNDKCEFVKANMTELNELIIAFKGIQAVFHTASPHFDAKSDVLYNVNVLGTKNVLEACKVCNVKYLIYTSSASVTWKGWDITETPETSPYSQMDEYTSSKVAAERLVFCHINENLKRVVIRPHTIYGEDDTHGFTKKIFENAKKMVFMGNPHKPCDFTYVENCAYGHVLAYYKLISSDHPNGKAYHISDNSPAFFFCFVSNLLHAAGYARPNWYIPGWILYIAAYFSSLFNPNGNFTNTKVKLLLTAHTYSCHRAIKDLDYRPPVSQKEAVSRCAKAFQNPSGVAPPPIQARSLVSWENALWTFAFVLLCVHILSFRPCMLWTLIFIPIFILLVIADVLAKRSSFAANYGLPFVGDFLTFKNGPISYLIRIYKFAQGPFMVQLFHKKIYVMAGDTAGSLFFSCKDDELSQQEVYQLTIPVFGKGVVYDATPDVRSQQINFLANGLGDAHMEKYVVIIAKECETILKSWSDVGTVNILEILSRMITMTASACLLGPEIRANIDENVADLYHDLDKGITLLANVNPHLPIPEHIKRDQARSKLRDLFLPVIKARKGKGKSKNFDILQVKITL